LLDDQHSLQRQGNNTFHKVRIGDYRIIYGIHENTLIILIVKIGHRKDVYDTFTAILILAPYAFEVKKVIVFINVILMGYASGNSIKNHN